MIDTGTSERVQQAYDLLVSELYAACNAGPDTLVSAPADEEQTTTVRAAICRALTDSRNGALQNRVAELLALAPSEDDDRMLMACQIEALGHYAHSQVTRLYESGAFD